MATIKFRRGSGQPTGLTAYEPAWDTANGRFFIHDGSTAVWVGARIDNNTSLAGNCAFAVPTQNAVKTYVDNVVAGGAVSSVDGVTGAVDLLAGSGISITNPTGSGKGITLTNIGVLSVNGSTGTITNIAVTNAAQTFTGLQTFTAGISASGGTFTGTQTFVNGAILQSVTTIPSGSTLTVNGNFVANGNVNLGDAVTDSITVAGLLVANGGLSAAGGTFANLTITGGLTVGGATVLTSSNGVTSVDGVTGAVDLLAGSGISITLPSGTAKGITLTNTGVLSFNGNAGAVQGVSSIAGTANQITASGSTGAVTLSLPSAVTMPGSLTVTGDLTVNGTTTTVNSNTLTIQDPIINIGGLTNGAPPVAGDVKDRGIAFQYYTGTTSATGYFGYDQSKARFVYTQLASIASEVVTGNAGNADFAGIFAPQGALTLRGECTANATVRITGAATEAATSITNTAFETLFTSSTGIGRIAVQGDALDPSLKGTITTTAFTAARTFTLPDITGTLPVATTGGATNGWLLRGQGASTVNTWIDPTTSGFTAFMASNSILQLVQGTKTGGTYGVLFSLGTGYRDVFLDSANDIVWNTTTNTLTVGNGNGRFEGIVDGGGF